MTVTNPEDPYPDTAMASGSDAGEPGGHLGPGDLTPDEERLLAALERDTSPGDLESPEEASPRCARRRTTRPCRTKAARPTTG